MPTSSPKKNWNWQRLKRLPIFLTVKCFGPRQRRPRDLSSCGRWLIHFLHISSVAFFRAAVFSRRLRWNSIRVPAWRDRVVEVQQQWLSLLRKCFLDAQAIGEIDSGADVAQAVFETEAMLLAANFLFVMTNDPTPLAQAHRGVENVLARLVVSPEPKKKRSTRGKP